MTVLKYRELILRIDDQRPDVRVVGAVAGHLLFGHDQKVRGQGIGDGAAGMSGPGRQMARSRAARARIVDVFAFDLGAGSAQGGIYRYDP